ncbi:MAG: GNAT family N-acetyltransferase [Candidatus Nitrosotenuis sp.]
MQNLQNLLELKIRLAQNKDKNQVLSFCVNTFEWGDYIDRVWDKWYAKKTLLVADHRGIAAGICNAALSANQLWIEGIRINPIFRRKGYATRLVAAAESLARNKRLAISRMIIANNNKKSLSMAKSLGYSLEQKWRLYNLLAKKQTSKAKIATDLKIQIPLPNITYSQSWKWFTLDQRALSKLVRSGQVIQYLTNKKLQAIGIWSKSHIDNDLVQLGYLNGTNQGLIQILRFMQNLAYENDMQRIQILIPDSLEIQFKGLESRMLFCLVKKKL